MEALNLRPELERIDTDPLDGLVANALEASKASNTRKAYARQWASFLRFCEARKAKPLPASPETVARFLALEAEEGRGESTWKQVIAAIRQQHREEGLSDPTLSPLVNTVLAGLRRQNPSDPQKAYPLNLEEIRRIVDCGDQRDRALLLLGYYGAFRSEELVRLEWDWLEHREEGIVVRLKRRKTNQEGIDMVPIPKAGGAYCPVQSLMDWKALLAQYGESRFVFPKPTAKGFNLAEHMHSLRPSKRLKALAKASGLPDAIVQRVSGHSLRRGAITEARRKGASMDDIMATTGHKQADTVLAYTEYVDIMSHNLGKYL